MNNRYMKKLLIIFIYLFVIVIFAPKAMAACSDITFCEGCVAAASCSWGGPASDVKCRDSGASAYVCPDSTYSIWWSLSGQCGNASANYCKGNTSVPPACSSFNGNCDSCLQQSACGYDGSNCQDVNPAVGNICPAGKTAWYWSSCKKAANVCGNPNGTPGKIRQIQTCRADGSGYDTSTRCDSACLQPNSTCAGGNLRCAASAGLGCTLQISLTCPTASDSCYSCVSRTGTSGTSGTTGTSGTPPATSGTPTAPAWIQTIDGDVHSNTKIDVP